MRSRITANALTAFAAFAVLAACPSGGGSAGNILPAGKVTGSHKQGAISWAICVKADADPKDTFEDGHEYCNYKLDIERGERCSIGEHWPECAERVAAPARTVRR